MKALRSLKLTSSRGTSGSETESQDVCDGGSPAVSLPWPVPLHPDAYDGGGLACNDETLVKEQREAVSEWIKSMGRQLFAGSFNLVSVPFPVRSFEPRSFLEKIADVWVYTRYLHEASASEDPVRRMQLVMTWFVAGLHHIFARWRKPFNPILGETWQARMSDGTEVFMEQISHHPPVSAFHMEGPGRAFKLCGVSQPNVALVLKHYGFKSHAKGFRYMEFPDGTRIDMEFPGYYVKNVVYSSRPRAEMDGSATFTDAKHNLQGVIHFGATPSLCRSDALWGGIYQLDAPAAARQRGHFRKISTVLDDEDEVALSPRMSLRRGNNEEEQLEDYFESASETADWDTRAEREDSEVFLSSSSAAAVAAAAAAGYSRSSPSSLDNSLHFSAATAAAAASGPFCGPEGVVAATAAAAAASPHSLPPAAPQSASALTPHSSFGPAAAPAPAAAAAASAASPTAPSACAPSSSSKPAKPHKRSHLSSIKRHFTHSSSKKSSSKPPRRSGDNPLDTGQVQGSGSSSSHAPPPHHHSYTSHGSSKPHKHGGAKLWSSKHRHHASHHSSEAAMVPPLPPQPADAPAPADAPQAHSGSPAAPQVAALPPAPPAAVAVSSTLCFSEPGLMADAKGPPVRSASARSVCVSAAGVPGAGAGQGAELGVCVRQGSDTSSPGWQADVERQQPEGGPAPAEARPALPPLPKAATLPAPLEEELLAHADEGPSASAAAASKRRIDAARPASSGSKVDGQRACGSTGSSSGGGGGGMFSNFSKMMGLGSTSSSMIRHEDDTPPGKLVVAVEGSWLSHFDVGGVRQWTLLTEPHGRWESVAQALPSDSRFRADLQALQQGDLKTAQTQKELMEKRQRQDKKARESSGAGH